MAKEEFAGVRAPAKRHSRSFSSLVRKYPCVFWTGDIDEEHFRDVVATILQIQEAHGETPIILFLATEGGDIDVALTFFEWIRSAKFHLITFASGMVASAGIIVFLAGEHRIASRFASFLLHNPSIVIEGMVGDESLMSLQKQLKEAQKVQIRLLAASCGISAKTIAEFLQKEQVLSVFQAKEFGLVHAVSYTRNPRSETRLREKVPHHGAGLLIFPIFVLTADG